MWCVLMWMPFSIVVIAMNIVWWLKQNTKMAMTLLHLFVIEKRVWFQLIHQITNQACAVQSDYLYMNATVFSGLNWTDTYILLLLCERCNCDMSWTESKSSRYLQCGCGRLSVVLSVVHRPVNVSSILKCLAALRERGCIPQMSSVF